VSADGKVLGIVPTAEAQQMAREAGLDLVEVGPNVQPPVCRVMDYKKFKAEQKKQQTRSAMQNEQKRRKKENGNGDGNSCHGLN
jgi:translation initiation factor IF-3